MFSFVERQMAIDVSDLAESAGLLGGRGNLGKGASRDTKWAIQPSPESCSQPPYVLVPAVVML